MLQETTSINKLAGIENELVIGQISRQLIKECLEIPLEQAVFTYPFLHYLISAAIVSIGLIIKEQTYKDAYGDRTLHAIQVMEVYCRRTWVSGKLIRNVLKLSQILSRVLAGSNHAHGQDVSYFLPGKGCHSMDLDGSRRYFPPAQLGLKQTGPLTAFVKQRENLQVGGPTDLSEQLHEPPQNGVFDSQSTGSSNVALPYAQFSGLTSLVADFDFEENVPRGVAPSQLPAQLEAPSTQKEFTGSQGVAASSEGATRCRSFGESASRAPTRRHSNVADSEEGVAKEMQWLEALFGNYLDSDLIIRPGE